MIPLSALLTVNHENGFLDPGAGAETRPGRTDRGRHGRGATDQDQMAARMETSRSQLDRVLDPDNTSIQLDTLMKAARAVGKVVEISIRPAKKRAAA